MRWTRAEFRIREKYFSQANLPSCSTAALGKQVVARRLLFLNRVAVLRTPPAP